MPDINFFFLSEKGKRTSNQDSYLAYQIDNDSWIFVIADGMGGTKGGELASKIAIQESRKYFQSKENSILNPKGLKRILEGIVKQTNLAIKKAKLSNDEISGMGTTLAALLIHNGTYAWANIGDSRIYRISTDDITQITTDHTYVQAYSDEHGSVTQEILKKYSHYLLKVLDGQGQIADLFPVDKNFEQLNDRTVFLLCSDGMIIDTIHTNTNLIKNYILGTPDLKDATNLLYKYALDCGSEDNITIITIEYGKLPRKELNIKGYNKMPENKGKKIRLRWVKNIFKRNKGNKIN